LPWRAVPSVGRFAACAGALAFLATAGLGLPAIPRLYLPVLVLLTIAVSTVLGARLRDRLVPLLCVYLALNAAAGSALLLF
jgi:uncharacterized membrane-anchored protein